MKKYRLLIISFFLLGIAFYVVNSYDATNTKGNSTVSGQASKENTQASTAPLTDIASQSDSSVPADNTQNDDAAVLGKAQDFTLVDLDGNEVSLSDFKGKKVFLNFWATWCPPCKAEMPEIEKVYQETKDSDLVILAVEIGEPVDTVKTFVDNNNYNFKVLLDLDQSVATGYGISAIPTSFFIDEEGNIVAKRIGAMTYDEMKENIAKLDQ